MKLWHIAQWGNPEEGADGRDTNVIVRAPDFDTAVRIAEETFQRISFYSSWRDGRADVVYLWGDDFSNLTEAKAITVPWVNHAFMLSNYQGWSRDFVADKWEKHPTSE